MISYFIKHYIYDIFNNKICGQKYQMRKSLYVLNLSEKHGRVKMRHRHVKNIYYKI